MTDYTTFVNQNMFWSIGFIGAVFFILLLNIYLWYIHKRTDILLLYFLHVVNPFHVYWSGRALVSPRPKTPFD